ncbi:lipoprotein LprG [Mumia flava]|uniref:Lipoprotein LprG n=1 Tax=Mumia flava TaxID=1348852 RepID=A0A2M9BDD2_9ACTN|nr:LppX_LprAFG lipoprotein [Mumia flava]PJJ55938.1 lipoprotein LprG [Mumia flava]
MLQRLTLAATAAALVLTTAACSGDGGADDDAAAADPADRLAAAQAVLDDATSLHVKVSTESIPSGVSGLLEADGVGTHAPAFSGDVKVSVSGVPLNAEVVSVDDTVYAKTGVSPSFAPLDPKSIGAPDPADFMRADDGLASLLTKTEKVEVGDESRDGTEVLTTITGWVPGEDVWKLIPSAQRDTFFDVTYRLTDDDVLHDATLEGYFYAPIEKVTYTIEVTASDESVDITAP